MGLGSRAGSTEEEAFLLKDGDNSWLLSVYQAQAKQSERKMDEGNTRGLDSPEPSRPGWWSRQSVFLRYRFFAFTSLVARGLASLKSRGPAATLRMAGDRVFPLPRQPFPLQLYADFESALGVRLPIVSDPAQVTASIIIPVHNELEFTLRCLHALGRSGDRSAFEVILVDDASSDASAATLARIDGLRYLRNTENLGFIQSCNAGAGIARGEFLVFLNNDTVVQPGWLDALLGTFASHTDTGLAGAKLVYPDGRLQEAGGIVFADGQAANYGRNDDAAHPRYNFVREADYCSGAAIAIRRALFVELEGFDHHYLPAYFEDTELAMRVRGAGMKVRYQPASVVVHFEGASSGTDLRRGVKAFQVSNQEKFIARWGHQLALSQPHLDNVGDAHSSRVAAATHRARRHVLIIDSYTPTPDRDSGSARMLALMRLLIEEDCAVVFFCQNLTEDGPYSEALRQLGVETWSRPWIRSIPEWLVKHGRRFDAIIVSRHYVLSPLLPMLRELAPQAHLVFDTVDLHFLREQREAAQSFEPAAAATAARTQRAELALVRAADSTWVVSPYERELLAQHEPSAAIGVVSNIHSIVADTAGFSAREGLLFVGSFRHPPNVDAALWMANDLFPLIRAELPELALHVVGADAPEAILALARLPGVRVHGHVADLDSLLDATRISVAPLRYGAGIKGKINHSLSRGLPVVATPCAIEGMSLVDGEDVLSADNAGDFAQAVVRLYRDEALWLRLRHAGIENTRRYFSPEVARAFIQPWLRSLRKKPAVP
ncbi:MAG: glycosyltransferase [Arenimonas sp.]